MHDHIWMICVGEKPQQNDRQDSGHLSNMIITIAQRSMSSKASIVFIINFHRTKCRMYLYFTNSFTLLLVVDNKIKILKTKSNYKLDRHKHII
jgi:hypothetical protein